MLCAISGEQPEVPVASRKSGHIFEKRLIETYISENGTDPVNGEPLAQDDLIELKSTRVVRPRPPALTSIPALLSTFQNEWDAIALETYTLKQQLVQTRQELSTALYEYDAALRVITKIQIERDEARDALSKVAIGNSSGNGEAMDVDGQSLSDDLTALVEETQRNLSSTRRKRPVPDDWATEQTISSFAVEEDIASTGTNRNVLSVDDTGALALLGSDDGAIEVCIKDKKKIVRGVESNSGAVTAAIWWKTKPVVTTATGSVLVLEGFEMGSQATQLGRHAGKATSVALHPSGRLLASTGVDKTYKLYDLAEMKQVTQVSTPAGIICGEFHPDGHLFTTGGDDGKIRLYDVKSGAEAAVFETEGALQALSFSENGTWLASVSRGQTGASIWDLRKSAIVKTLDIASLATSVRWDYTGQFLAIAGPKCVAIEQYSKTGKKWSEPLKKAINASLVAWGAGAHSIYILAESGSVAVLTETT